MFKVLVFVCASTIPHANCDRSSAEHVINGPSVTGIQQCAFQAQALAAQVDGIDRDKEYIRAVCTSHEREASK